MGNLKDKLRARLTYANVVSTMCLFVLLGGTAAAVDGSLPGQNTVGSADIINGEVAHDDLGANSVGTGQIADGRVKNDDLGPGAADTNTTRDDGIRSVDVRDDTLPGGGLDGDDIDESSLGIVPNADQLDGLDSSDFMPSTSILTGALDDNPDGHAQGWDPDGITEFFFISVPGLDNPDAVVALTLKSSAGNPCVATGVELGQFPMECHSAPIEGAELNYAIIAP